MENDIQLGEILIKKNIISASVFEKARLAYLEEKIKIILKEDSISYRSFPQILVEDFNADSDLVYHETAKFFAFRELNVPVEDIPESQIDWMKENFNSLEASIKQKIIKNEIILFETEKIHRRTGFKFLVVNPTSRQISKIFFEISSGNTGFDIVVIKKKEFEKLLSLIQK